jgi:serine protease SohB
MLNFFTVYGLFLLKVITLVAAILLTFGGIIAIATKNKLKPKEKIEIKKLNDKFKKIRETLNANILEKIAFKKLAKTTKQQAKKAQKKLKTATTIQRPRIFVLDFKGDIKASKVANLREEITAILTVATPKDEVIVKIESSGGMVPNYGLAASQLKRIRDHHIPLIATVDSVAASGGYMMACVADRIFAAPFAIIGSIGVIAQLPNFHRLLKKHNIDFEQVMAGDFKRTLSLFGENTEKGRQKLSEEVEETHKLFKDFIVEHRPFVDINTVATGEYWHGTRAKELRLIDEIITSDDYLLKASDKTDLFEINYTMKKNILDKMGLGIQKTLEKLFYKQQFFN